MLVSHGVEQSPHQKGLLEPPLRLLKSMEKVVLTSQGAVSKKDVCFPLLSFPSTTVHEESRDVKETAGVAHLPPLQELEPPLQPVSAREGRESRWEPDRKLMLSHNYN